MRPDARCGQQRAKLTIADGTDVGIRRAGQPDVIYEEDAIVADNPVGLGSHPPPHHGSRIELSTVESTTTWTGRSANGSTFPLWTQRGGGRPL
jgi:hypothetical protein